MKLLLVRDEFASGFTTGRLYADGRLFGHTVEDVVRQGDIGVVKIPGKTAIPAGTYRVRNTYSPKFGETMPLVLDVPGFAGIRVHGGASAASTEGCIVVSRTKVSDGRLAPDASWRTLRAAIGSGTATLRIRNGAVVRVSALAVLAAGLLAWAWWRFRQKH